MRKKVIAYDLTAVDGDGYFFENAPSSTFCTHCQSCVSENYFPKQLELGIKGLDGCFTYDDRLIVSERFKDFVGANNYLNCDFVCVDADKRLYTFKPQNKLIFDVVKREVIFDAYCEVCQQYEQIAGAYPVFLIDVDDEIKDGFFRTDVEFGSGREKSPLIILGTDTYKKLKKAKFSGFEFKPVYLYSDDYFEA